ncbi:ABC transporter ATP-binding protein [Ochrobactrum sp. A-1]|uniref:ABC transporter ATP-binding protein n=1 Tax=Ochrobactrum sp. A-1 TaxID=2920940 RepID=UPI001F0A76B9|nr:ABC transporter ATP-binding protein [Ochrobactrum sp. A-1]
MLECRKITKRYGGHFYSLGSPETSVDFDVKPGELFAVIGPSGCGKSTLLKLIGGFTSTSAGKITIQGRDVTGLPPYLRPTNTVFQNYALFPHLTIGENVSFGLEMARVPQAERAARVEDALRLVGLASFSRRYVSEMSGGQLQRVALARAIVNKPAILLLDEPLGALDLKLRRQMQDEIVELKRALGMTILHVTHDQEEACAIADRIAVMNAGHILQIDSPVDLYRRPRTAFVAEFINAGTILRGDVKLAGQDGRLCSKAGTFLGRNNCGEVSGKLALLLPRYGAKVRRISGNEVSDVNSLVATVVRIAFTGTEFAVQLEAKTGDRFTVQLTIEEMAQGGLDLGAQVHASWAAENLQIVRDDLPEA